MGQECASHALSICSLVRLPVSYHRALLSQPSHHSSASHARSSISLQLFGQVGCGRVAAWVGGLRGTTKQVQEATSCPDHPGSLFCGLAIVKPALLTCHWRVTPPPLGGQGVAPCSLKETSHCGRVTKGSLKECPH